VVAVGDERTDGCLPSACLLGLLRALAEVGVDVRVGVGEGDGDRGAQFAAVAAVQFVFDRRELADGRAVFGDPGVAVSEAGEGGEGLLVLGGPPLPCGDRGSVAGDGLFDLGPSVTACGGELGGALGEAFVRFCEPFAGGGGLRGMPVTTVVGLGGARCEEVVQRPAACAQLVAAGGCDALGRSGGGAVECERLGGAASERFADAVQRIAVGELEAVGIGGGEVEARGDAMAGGGAVGPLAAVAVLTAENARTVDAQALGEVCGERVGVVEVAAFEVVGVERDRPSAVERADGEPR